jgi:hypothetical protein
LSATRAKLRFSPKIIFLEINRVNNIITWRRRRCTGPRLLNCDIPAQSLIGLVRILISTSCNFFSRSPSLKTPKLSVLGLERWVTDREVLPGCAWVRTKCAGKTCVGLWGYSWGPRELSGVGGAGLREAGRYNWYQSRLSRFHGRVRSQLRRHGVHGWCGPWVVTQHGTCAGTRPTDVAKRGRSWLGVDRRGRRSSEGGVCDIPTQGLIGLIRILISTSCNFFYGSPSLKTPKLSVLGLERWVSDREVLPGCAWVRTKCAGKTCVGLWGYSWGLRELPGVGGPGLGKAGRYMNGLSSLSVDVGVGCHRRTKEAGRNYSSATLSLPHHRCRQENQDLEEPRFTGKT